MSVFFMLPVPQLSYSEVWAPLVIGECEKEKRGPWVYWASGLRGMGVALKMPGLQLCPVLFPVNLSTETKFRNCWKAEVK